MKPRVLCAIYRNTRRQGMTTPQAVPDSLFDADKAITCQFYAAGRRLYTIETIIKLEKEAKR